MSEALDVLGLRPGASPAEIKEAYRDLVKVWHPDRFGNDARLREKAEDKLKQINDAYRLLQNAAGGGSVAGWSGVSGANPSGVSHERPVAHKNRAARMRSRVSPGWIYAGMGIGLAILVSSFLVGSGGVRPTQPSSAPAQPVPSSEQRTVPSASNAGPAVDAAATVGRQQRSGETRRLDEAGSATFRVRALSDAESRQLESACSVQRQVGGEAAYQACVKAQLNLIMNPVGRPDLSSLSEGEGESIDAVCSEAKRLRGLDRYNRCLTTQLASLAAETARPDLSKLDDADRDAIESACRSAKVREGPAAYDRCRANFVKALAQAK
ncbi:DnaJ domain-containing protein [Edaphobacter aggregans]|uniref:DnaJ domain-containing protein n=1 Tax=Edaphobacter aggregans TaxID=570835 RepID=UPI0014701441|nr:DnaJ domain-containing protein [Edaphobacter aggregans]